MAKLNLIIICLLFMCPLPIHGDDPPYGEVRLLAGFRYQRSSTTDTVNGLIFADGGLNIEFESGISEGYAADPTKQKDYIWFREQIINGHKVFFALTRPGDGTKWEPKRWRDKKHCRVLMITYPGKFSSLDAANFYAEVLDEKEIADTLLMALTFDPTK